MEFRDTKSIYIQIAEVVCEKIILLDWKEEEKILSVRDLAVHIEVNPNTVMRTYDFLQNQGIIYNKRGIGFFVAADGIKKAKSYLKQEYITNELPVLFKNMELLNISVNDIEKLYMQYKSKNK